ncbi:unannotated protein [freshwater metagenome]|uniref:Unannotated protein n=1 Tax=freshwater metagenome TaxID=449393 RepID=A0A6J7R1Y1_9ZZZZ
MLIEHHDGSQPRARRPYSGTTAHHDVHSPGSGGPFVGHQRRGQPRLAKSGGDCSRRGRCRVNDQRRPMTSDVDHQRQRVGERSDDVHTGRQRRTIRADGAPRPRHCSHHRRRIGGDQERAQTCCRPAQLGPFGQFDDLRCRAHRRPLGDRQQLLRRHCRIGRPEADHPATHLATMQRDAHQRTDRDALTHLGRDEVIELFVEPGDVRDDPSHQSGRRLARDGHTPTARMKASRRLTCSHVKSGRLRPK